MDYEEDVEREECERKVDFRGKVAEDKKAHARLCDICLGPFNHPWRHAVQSHLPWYVAPQTACWVCGTQEQTEKFLQKHIQRCHPSNSKAPTFENRDIMYVQLMNGLFLELSKFLNVTFPDGLVSKTNMSLKVRTQQQPTQFTDHEQPLVNLYISANNLKPVQKYTIPKPPHLQLYHLIHWKLLKNLIGELTKEDQNWIYKFEERKSMDGEKVEDVSVSRQKVSIQVIDSHCPFDQLMKRDGSAVLHELDHLHSKQ